MTQVCYRGVDYLYTTMYFDWFIYVVNFASKRLPSELNASVIKLLGEGMRKRLEFWANQGGGGGSGGGFGRKTDIH